jgi:hypothetical protein
MVREDFFELETHEIVPGRGGLDINREKNKNELE